MKTIAFKDLKQYQDKKTWDLFCEGDTKGVFQLESKLGSSWARRVQPRSIEELSDLVALIRPGCLDTIVDGKSMTKHYVDRKHKKDEITYVHQALEPVLKNTYGVLVYQEQAIRISMEIAGFTPEEGDSLRKAMGKKDAALMKTVKDKFLSGCASHGVVDDETANKIFDLIQASARYSFNASHSVSYAINAFMSAYCKAHDPIKFYRVYLNHASSKINKQQEIHELISNARRFGIEVYPPSLDHFYKEFTENRDSGVIYYGYSSVKNVGEGEQEKIESHIGDIESILGKKIRDFNWMELLLYFSSKIKKTAFVSLVSVGALNGKNNNKQRNEMLFEYKIWKDLTDNERSWILDQYGTKKYTSLALAIRGLVNNCKINKKRIVSVLDLLNSLLNPPYSLVDSIEWKSGVEDKLMGCSLSCSKTDSVISEDTNCTCRDLTSRNSREGHGAILIKINRCNEYTIKNGDRAGETMAFITGEDFTGECDSFVIFSEAYKTYKKLLFTENTVLLIGIVKNKDGDLSFIVNEVKQV